MDTARSQHSDKETCKQISAQQYDSSIPRLAFTPQLYLGVGAGVAELLPRPLAAGRAPLAEITQNGSPATPRALRLR